MSSPIGVPNLAGWREVRLVDLCKLISRGTAPVYVDDSPVLAIGQRCVRETGFDPNAARPHSPRVKNFLRPARGDILLNSTGTGTIGRSCIFNDDGDYMVDGHVTILRTDRSKVDPRWIEEILRSPWGQKHLESHCFTGSTNQVELSRSDLLETSVPVPDLDEQRRIAEILDAVDRQLSDGTKELTKLKLLREALVKDSIAAAIAASGEYRRLGALAQISSGVTLGSEPTGGSSVELPYLRVANVQDGYFDTGEMKLVRVLRSQVERYSLRAGDLLLTEGGDWDKLGRGAVWDGHLQPCLHQNHLFRVRCDPQRILPEYLALYTSSAQGRAYFARIAKQTSNLATINSTELKAMEVPTPPLDLQRKLVDSIQNCVESIERSNKLLAAIQSIRQGLVDDLLTGRVRVDSGRHEDPKDFSVACS